ncbi:hypothetical protein AKO1_005885 [Acrasis kona]|uniref:Pumilio domain-containing protein NOP9 n=1 Tax=Acrasis kona TaxID=1008807 RepID=A0AAW2YM90_9EUKA
MMSKDEFPSDYDRMQFCSSVLDEAMSTLSGEDQNDFYLSLNDPLSSRILQTMCEVSSPEKICEFFKSMSGRYHIIMKGRFSSYILETILKNAHSIAEALEKNKEEGDQDENELKMGPLLNNMCKELKGKVQDLTFDKVSSFLMRAFVAALVKNNKSHQYRAIVDELLKPSPDNTLDQWIQDPLGIGVLVSLLATIPSEHQSHEKIIRFVLGMKEPPVTKDAKEILPPLDITKAKNQVIQYIKNPKTTHLADALVNNMSKDTFDLAYINIFRGNMVEWCKAQSSHYVVINIIRHSTHKEQFILMYNEMLPYMPNLWKTNRDVLIALAEQCCKFHEYESDMIRDLVKNASTTTSSSSSTINLQTSSDTSSSSFVHQLLYRNGDFDATGCILLSTLLQFKVNSTQIIYEQFISHVTKEEFLKMCKDKNASPMIEKLLTNPSNEELFKNLRYRVIKKLSGNFADLAKDKCGSHVVEKCIFASTSKRKGNIAKELVDKEQEVRDSRCGNIVWEKCRIGKYKTNANEWLKQDASSTFNMFKDILEDEPEDKSKPVKSTTDAEKTKESEKKKTDKKGLEKKRNIQLMEHDVFADAPGAKKAKISKKNDDDDDEGGRVDLSIISKAMSKK